MKTHVLKIALGSWSSIYTLGKMKIHLYFWRGQIQNIKMGYSPYILMVEIFLEGTNSKYQNGLFTIYSHG
jgi:hypothetical protein